MPNLDAESEKERQCGHAENDPNIATALALLFLSKGRRPTLLSNLIRESVALAVIGL